MKKILTKKCELCSLDFEYNSGNKRESNSVIGGLLEMGILEKINEFGFKNSIRKNKRISLNKESSYRFLEWISKDIKIQKEYLYKWKI